MKDLSYANSLEWMSDRDLLRMKPHAACSWFPCLSVFAVRQHSQLSVTDEFSAAVDCPRKAWHLFEPPYSLIYSSYSFAALHPYLKALAEASSLPDCHHYYNNHLKVLQHYFRHHCHSLTFFFSANFFAPTFTGWPDSSTFFGTSLLTPLVESWS